MFAEVKEMNVKELEDLIALANREINRKTKEDKQLWAKKIQDLVDECPYPIYYYSDYDITQLENCYVDDNNDLHIN